jgi:hypothetical protein
LSQLQSLPKVSDHEREVFRDVTKMKRRNKNSRNFLMNDFKSILDLFEGGGIAIEIGLECRCLQKYFLI